MGIFGKLFGSSSASTKTEAAAAKTMEYKGFVIEAAPYKNGGQWQLAGSVSKDGKVHKFVRADQFTSQTEAVDLALDKGQLIVDQLGESMFH
ncbi:HlyU family transcriptional regulator [Aestuariivirga litoralis]|uniref:HlyU family transcriptional regulator n=1 Tax=Aestuariivirga litoralis TaxID=2650924 RepID=UPI0018C8004E|nr:HlyU family transcriptional regulator [Aestuariivirga litoralis]MBG1232169.1 hypothetical protein [Aestuariivirga litoralis]